VSDLRAELFVFLRWLTDRPDTCIALNLGLGGGESGEREMANVSRIIAAPNIDEDFPTPRRVSVRRP
jgi:hypothetical protein